MRVKRAGADVAALGQPIRCETLCLGFRSKRAGRPDINTPGPLWIAERDIPAIDTRATAATRHYALPNYQSRSPSVGRLRSAIFSSVRRRAISEEFAAVSRQRSLSGISGSERCSVRSRSFRELQPTSPAMIKNALARSILQPISRRDRRANVIYRTWRLFTSSIIDEF
jgi:hypothetical protein